MDKISNNLSTERRDVQSKAKNKKSTLADDASQLLINASHPLLPMESHSSELQPDPLLTNQNNSENTITVLEKYDLSNINKKVNFFLDKRFQNKSEMKVNREVLETTVAEIVGQLFSTGNTLEHIGEAKLLTEKYKALRDAQSKLNTLRYTLEKQVNESKRVIKSMIDQKNKYTAEIARRMQKHVRTVGTQVCFVSLPKFIGKPLTQNSASVSKHYMGSILSPEEPCSSKTLTINKEVDVKNNNKPSTSKVCQSQFVNSRGCKEKETQDRSKSNITTRSMSTRHTKVEEFEYIKPKLPEKVEPVKEMNKDKKNVKKGRKLTEVDKNKSSRNGIPAVSEQEKYQEIITKKEKMDEAVPGSSSKIKSIIMTRSMSKKSANNRTCAKKETYQSESNIFTNRMPTSQKQVEEIEYIKPKSPVSVKSIKELNTEKKNVKKVRKLTEVDKNKSSRNGIPAVSEQEKYQEIITKKEKMDEAVPGSSSEIKSIIMTRSMSKKSANNRTCAKKETPCQSKSNLITRKMSTGQINNSLNESKKENKSGRITKVHNKGFVIGISTVIKKDRCDKISNKNVIIDEGARDIKISQDETIEISDDEVIIISDDEVIEISDDEVIEISDDELIQLSENELTGVSRNEGTRISADIIEISEVDIMEFFEDDSLEDTITVVKKGIEEYDKKEAEVQVNMEVDIPDHSYSEGNEPSSSQAIEPLIKVRSPDVINELYTKSIKSASNIGDENTFFCQIPKYPLSPQHPPNVSKPPAPILQVEKYNYAETMFIKLKWSYSCKIPENILMYQVFFYQASSNDDWMKIGEIKASKLPMKCSLSVAENGIYYFIIRAVDSKNIVGDFSNLASIKL